MSGVSSRFGYRAYYPSKAFRVHPSWDGRDLIDEVARIAATWRPLLLLYGYRHPQMEVGWVDQHLDYADWVLRDERKPHGEVF